MLRDLAWLSRFALLGLTIAVYGGSPTCRASSDLEATLGLGGTAEIKGLALVAPEASYHFERRPEGTVPVAEVKLQYHQTQSGWTLVRDNDDIMSTDGSRTDWPLSIPIPLNETKTTSELTCVGPQGQIQKTTLTVTADDWPEIRSEAAVLERSRFELVAGLRLESDALTDPRHPPISELGVGFIAAARVPVGLSRLTLNGDLGVTLASSTSNSISYRDIDLDGLASWRLPGVSEPWSMNVGAGLFYRTLLSSTASLGYSNVSGPLLRVGTERHFSGGRSLALEVGGAPVFAGGFSLLPLGSHDLESRLSYETFIGDNNRFPCGIFAQAVWIRFAPEQATVSEHAVTVGALVGLSSL